MEIRRRRAAGDPPTAGAGDPDLNDRLSAMEDEVRRARKLRQDAERRAREAARQARADARERPSDEELGYIRTDDSFWKILSDAREEWTADVREKSVRERAADLLDEVADALRGERKPPRTPET